MFSSLSHSTLPSSASPAQAPTDSILPTVQREVEQSVDVMQSQDHRVPPWEVVDVQLAKYNLTSKETGGGGDCQYRVIADILQRNGIVKGFGTVRYEVAVELANNSEPYAKFVPATDGQDATASYKAFVDRTNTDGEWGDHVTLQAACNVYGLSLTMFCSDNRIVDVEPTTTKTIHGNIAYLNGVHYRGTEALLTKSKKPKPKKVKTPKNTMSLCEYMKLIQTLPPVIGANVQNKVPTNKTLWTIADNTEINSEYKEEKAKIESVNKQCHNLLYDACSIVGTKAQNDIMRLLCLRILKAQFTDDTSELWASCVAVKADKNLSDTKFSKYMKYCKDMKTLTHPDLDFFKEWRFLVRDLLKYALPSVYGEEDERFNCDNYTVCIKMIDKMENDIPSSKAFSDAFSTTCGDIHEMFRAYGGGKAAKELGQFFTTRELIHATFHGLDLPELLKHNHKVSVYDPCMGTGGFLTRMFNLFEVDPDNIYGCETESDTIKFGQMSLVLTTGKVGNNIVKCNSISENPLLVGTKKMDAIVTNPPFGTKMKYADLKKTFEETFPDTSVKFKDIYPINTSNGACLFIQHCVYMLAHGGMCALVLPDGELFDSHSKWSAKFRKWWCENVNIRTILKVPAGVFKHAGVRTNVVVFTKDGPTTSIDYKELTDKTCTSINELFSVDVADIVQMGYNLDYKAYLKEEGNVYDVPMVALGDVCTFKKGKHIKVVDYKEGTIPVISSARQPSGTHNEANCPPNTICIAASGSYAGFIHRYNVPIWASHCIIVQSKDETVATDDYVFQVLRIQQERLYNCRPSNAGQPNIYAHNLEPYKIPLPPLQTQHQIVQELETIETSIQTLRTRVDQLKREKELFHKYGRKGELMGLWEGCEWRKLGEVCDINSSNFKRHPTSYGSEQPTKYRFHTGSPSTVLYTAEADILQSVIVINKTNGQGKCHITFDDKHCSIAQQAFVITEKKMGDVNFNFVFHCLMLSKHRLELGYNGCNHKNLSMSYLSAYKIPIPTPAIQTQSIAIFEAKAKHIQTLNESIQREEQHIKDLQQLGKDVIASFCSTKE